MVGMKNENSINYNLIYAVLTFLRKSRNESDIAV